MLELVESGASLSIISRSTIHLITTNLNVMIFEPVEYKLCALSAFGRCASNPRTGYAGSGNDCFDTAVLFHFFSGK